MAAFDFPNSPSTNQTYTANGVTFQWNGSVWTRYSASQGAQGSTGAQGAQGAVGSPGAQGATGAQGAQGHQGAVGAQGAAGAQGSPGHQGTAGSNASISTNANNRVITGGSGTNLVGESTLTYNPSILTITNASGASEITLVTPSANDSGIYFNDGSNDGAISYDHSTRNMNFRANSQTKFRIEGDTKKLKLQRAPSSDVDITLAQAQRWGYSDSYQGLIIGNPAVGNMSSLFLNYDPSSNTSGSFAGDGREIVVRKNAKMIVPNAADNTFYNAIEFNAGGDRDDGVTRFRQGIIVSNDQADENVLDDYEEGSFTPNLSMSNGGHSLGYAIQLGKYTKIGNMVHVEVYIKLNAISSNGSGYLRLNNLPFTSVSGSSNTYGGLHCPWYNSMNNTPMRGGLVERGANWAFLYHQFESGTGTIQNASIASAFGINSTFILVGSYTAQ